MRCCEENLDRRRRRRQVQTLSCFAFVTCIDHFAPSSKIPIPNPNPKTESSHEIRHAKLFHGLRTKIDSVVLKDSLLLLRVFDGGLCRRSWSP